MIIGSILIGSENEKGGEFAAAPESSVGHNGVFRPIALIVSLGLE
jgi:hypothetical protein